MMNALNSLLYALQSHGGFATTEQLEAIRPKLKDVAKTSLRLVDNGLATWEEAPDGSQELCLTDRMLEMMSPNCLRMTVTEISDAIRRGDNLVGRTILVRRK